MSLEAYEDLLNQVQTLRDRCADLEHDLEFAYKRSKVLADMLGIPVHESPEVTGTILGLVRGSVEMVLKENKDLRWKMPSKLQIDFCNNIDLHLHVTKLETAKDCCEILMENVNDHGYQFGCEEAFVAIKKKFGLAL